MEITNVNTGNYIIKAYSNTIAIVDTTSKIVFKDMVVQSSDIIIPTSINIVTKSSPIKIVDIAS